MWRRGLLVPKQYEVIKRSLLPDSIAETERLARYENGKRTARTIAGIGFCFGLSEIPH